MRLKEIFEPALFESGHLFAPSFDELMISERDLYNIARLALRDINKYSHRETTINIDLSSGAWVVPPEMGKVRSVMTAYQSGNGFRWNAKQQLFRGPEGPETKSLAVCIQSDWTLSKVKVEDMGVESNLLEDQPSNHHYLDQHQTPKNLEPVYQIEGYELDTLHREDHDKLMAAHFMMTLGSSRMTFQLSDDIADSGGQDLYARGKDLRDEAFEDLIESSDQFLGILDEPEFR